MLERKAHIVKHNKKKGFAVEKARWKKRIMSTKMGIRMIRREAKKLSGPFYGDPARVMLTGINQRRGFCLYCKSRKCQVKWRGWQMTLSCAGCDDVEAYIEDCLVPHGCEESGH